MHQLGDQPRKMNVNTKYKTIKYTRKMLLWYVVRDKPHINTAVLYITHSQEMYVANLCTL